MIAGALPAFLIFFIRLFVPESHKWEAERDKGGTNHWATRDLLGVALGAAGAMAVILVWSPVLESLMPSTADNDTQKRVLRGIVTFVGLATALLGYIYPVLRYVSRAETAGQLPPNSRSKYIGRLMLGACLSGVPLLGTWGSLQWAPKWAIELANQLPADSPAPYAKEYMQISLASGAILGTIVAALMGGWLGRRITYALLCIGSFIALVYLYQANNVFGLKLLVSAFVAGGVTASFYGWFPLYFPELFPTSIRATSQGFAYNFGRVLSAIGSLQTATLTAYFAQGIALDRIAVDAFPRAGATLAGIYLIGLFIIWLGPETKGKPLPE
jgi:hypothetical protein